MADQKPNSTPDQRPDQQPELTRDTDAYLHDHDTPSHGGRAGGTMAQAIGSEDEHKRADEPDAGTTRHSAVELVQALPGVKPVL